MATSSQTVAPGSFFSHFRKWRWFQTWKGLRIQRFFSICGYKMSSMSTKETRKDGKAHRRSRNPSESLSQVGRNVHRPRNCAWMRFRCWHNIRHTLHPPPNGACDPGEDLALANCQQKLLWASVKNITGPAWPVTFWSSLSIDSFCAATLSADVTLF